MKSQFSIMLSIYIFVLAYASLPLASGYLQPAMEMNTIEAQLEANNKTEARQQIKELLQESKTKKQKWTLIEEYMLEGSLAHKYDVYIGSSMISWTNAPTQNLFTKEETVPYLTEYVEMGPVNGYMVSAAKQLASYYQNIGNYEKADQVLVEAAARALSNSKGYYMDELFKQRIELAIDSNKLRNAENLIVQLQEQENENPINLDLPVMISLLETEILLKKGELKRAYEKVSNDLITLKNQWDEANRKHLEEAGDSNQELIEEYGFEDGVFARELLLIKKDLEKAIKLGTETLSTVEGSIMRSDGVPLSGVGVFLRDRNSVNMSVRDDERLQTTTDENGFYQFHNVIPGSYQIHLGVTAEQVDGWVWSVPLDDWIDVKGEDVITYPIQFNPQIKIEAPVNHEEFTSNQIHFKWEQVNEADYYDLNLCLEYDNGSICSPIKTNIEQNEVILPIEELYSKTTGTSYSGDGPLIETVQPESLLGFANSEGTFSWYVKAYDQEGRTISQSNGYIKNEQATTDSSIFYLKHRTLTEADRLLLDQKILEALHLYKQKVEENPDDLHSLRMVIRLIGFESEEREEPYRERYTEKALPYLLALAEKQPTEDTIYQVISYFYDKRDWENYEQWYKKYEQIVKNEIPVYVQLLHATAQMHQGNLEKARKQFYDNLQKDPSHRFIGNLVAIELYQHNTIEQALQTAEDFPPRESFAKDWLAIVNDIEKTPKNELNHALEVYFYGTEGEMQSFIEAEWNTPLGRLIKALRTVN